MKALTRGPISKRVRKIWLSTAATIVGTLLVLALVLLVEGQRNTDLADASQSITALANQSDAAGAPPILFENVADAWGVVMRHGPGPRRRLLTEDTGSGLAWGDIDGDGDWDLFVVNFPGPEATDRGPDRGNRLYRNDGQRFTDVTEQAGVADPTAFGMGAWFVDVDGDHDQDLFVTAAGPNRLFQNQGDGTFVEIAERCGLADPAWSTGAAWGDFDRDGDLDLYVCNYVDYAGVQPPAQAVATSMMGSAAVPFTLNPNAFDPVPNRLYRNRGDGTFEEVAAAFHVDDPEGRSLSATFCDLDGDGWLDLYVNNDVSTNRLFRNAGARRDAADGDSIVPFEDLSTLSGTADPRGSMGLSVGETGSMNRQLDSLPDLFITHWIAQENALYQSVSDAGGFALYLDKTRDFHLAEISLDAVGWGCVFADFDRDGRDDLAVVNGSTLERPSDPARLAEQAPFLFWNDGRRFHNVAPRAGPAMAARYGARGLAAADFDDDGDLDLAVSVNRGTPLLLRNDTPTTHRGLKVRLNGPPAACWGARVQVQCGDQRQIRWWGSDVSFLSGHAAEMIFGLGSRDRADSLTVSWSDGTQSALRDVPAGRYTVEHTAGSGTSSLVP